MRSLRQMAKLSNPKVTYTAGERDVLANLVEDYIDIIKDRSNTKRTRAKKTEVWSIIMEKFNAIAATNGTPARTGQQLTKLWDNLVQRYKKLQETIASDSDKIAVDSEGNNWVTRVASMMGEDISPLDNPFDCDASDDTIIVTEADSPTKSHSVEKETRSRRRVRQTTEDDIEYMAMRRKEHSLAMEVLALKKRKLEMEIANLESSGFSITFNENASE